MMPHRRNVIAFGLSVLLVGPAAPALAQAPQPKLKVVTSFTILADFARIIGGDRVEIASIVGPDADAHAYSPTPGDAKKLADAHVVIVNGFGFETFLPRLIKSSGTKATIVTATNGVKPIKAAGGHGHGHNHAHGEDDPHAWQSVANAKIYVTNIRDALITADPEGKPEYEAAATRYLAELEMLDADMKQRIGAIPASQRVVIATHDAFRYFTATYGLQFRALRGVSSDAEPTAKDVAAIIRQIKSTKVRAVFLENVSDERMMRRIADETGAKLGGSLISDALTAADGVAPTYIDMMRHNAKQVVDALTP